MQIRQAEVDLSAGDLTSSFGLGLVLPSIVAGALHLRAN